MIRQKMIQMYENLSNIVIKVRKALFKQGSFRYNRGSMLIYYVRLCVL